MRKFLLSLLVFGGTVFAETSMDRYLTEIPFLPKYIKPLLVLDIDYSGSMRFPVYYWDKFKTGGFVFEKLDKGSPPRNYKCNYIGKNYNGNSVYLCNHFKLKKKWEILVEYIGSNKSLEKETNKYKCELYDFDKKTKREIYSCKYIPTDFENWIFLNLYKYNGIWGPSEKELKNYSCSHYNGDLYNGDLYECKYIPTNSGKWTLKDTKFFKNVSYEPQNYYGYFNNNRCYKYDTELNAWVVDKSCDCSDGIGSDSCVSGKFLNFVSTTRSNILLKALIGGRVYRIENNNFLYSTNERDFLTLNLDGRECKVFIDNQYDKENFENDYAVINVTGKNCPLHFERRILRIKTSNIPLKDRNGILQKVYGKLDIAVFSFSSDDYPAGEGKILYASTVDNSETLDDLVKKIENVYVGGCTYTGESLLNIEKYLQQNSTNPIHWSGYINPDTSALYCANYGNLIYGKVSVPNESKDAIDRHSKVDPYYTLDKNGKLIPVGCRKVYVLLISDGEWNGEVDPKEIAYELHTYDLRNDISKNQTATVYTLYVFSDSQEGKNAMSTIAFCGGYTPDQVDDASDICTNDESSLNIDSIDKAKTFYTAKQGKQLEEALTTIIRKILESSGTAVAIPTTKKAYNAGGSGLYISSYLMQATFQPTVEGERTVNWIGHAYNWWYWGNGKVTTIREDNINPFFLNVYATDNYGNVGDRILTWKFNSETNELEIKACEPNKQGEPSDNCETYTSYRDLKPVVDLGQTLEETTADSRTIYVGNGDELQLLSVNILKPYVNNNSTLARKLYKWIKGIDVNGLRIRTTDGKISANGYGSWKLGDIVYASPLLVDYGNYTVAYIASNDGMLHAFYMGYARKTFNPLTPIHLQNSRTDANTDKIGQELWAFIPKNALPYLRYYADPTYGLEPNKHLYIQDLSPYLVEYKGRLILIGGMRLGGAVGSKDTDAVNPPDVCKDIGDNCGLSEYYALDITDPNNPKLLWEFSAPDLGFSTSGPGVFKFADNAYVVFGSGPINYLATYQKSDKDTLKFYVLNLLTGDVVKKIDTGIERAFAGRIFQNAKLIGNTEYLPVGYTTGKVSKTSVTVNWDNDEDNPVETTLDNIDFTFYTAKPVIDFGSMLDNLKNCWNYEKFKRYMKKECSWLLNEDSVPYKELEDCLKPWRYAEVNTFFFGKECWLYAPNLGIDIDIGNYYKDISLNEYAEENYAIKDGAALYFEINRSGTVDGNYLLTLYNSRDKKPPQVGGNPYIYNNSKDNPDIEYWTTLYREDFPAKVSIEKNFGSFSGGIVVLSVKDNGGSIDINWQDIQTMTDTNGDKIKFKPITSKVILGKCGNNKYYLFGGTGRWFYKEDNLETEEYMPNNFIFGIPVTCQNGSCNLASVEDVTDNINGTSNSQYGWYIKLANSNSTAELLREKDISDPNLSETTKVVIFATVQPSYSYCSISQGQTRFWAINCSNGGAINAKQATGNIVTQLSTSQIVNISLQKTFIGNNGGNSNTQASTRYTRLYAGIAATAAPQLILPYQLTTGKLLLWLEY